MTKKSQVDFIIKKAIEANAEIVALKFGCEVLIADKVIMGVSCPSEGSTIATVMLYNPGGFNGEDYDGDVLILWSDDWAVQREWGKDGEDMPKYKTLGRPIHLADVLLAIIEETSSNRTAVVLESSGQFRVTDFELHPPISKLGPCWNLRADDLREQSEETIQFIYDLLKP